MSYELYYDTGGHGGPYPDHDTACIIAQELLKGCCATRSIEVRPRNSPKRGGYSDAHSESTYVRKVNKC